MEIDAFVNILTNIAITVSGFIILALSATAQALTITYVLSSGVGALIIILVLRKEFGKIFSDFDRKLIPADNRGRDSSRSFGISRFLYA